jgi:hypothetical protein
MGGGGSVVASHHGKAAPQEGKIGHEVHLSDSKTIEWVDDINESATFDTASVDSELDSNPRVLTIFDWDDTLFPTTWASGHGLTGGGSKSGLPIAMLQLYMQEFIRTIELAKSHGDVCIVTMATCEWVQGTIDWLLPPHMHEFLEVNNVPVLSARDFAEPTGQVWVESFTDGTCCEARRMAEMVAQKKAAMMCALRTGCAPKVKSCKSFQRCESGASLSSGASISTAASSEAHRGEYTQVVAIGDSDVEMAAAHDLAFHSNCQLVTKTVKLKGKPNLVDVLENLRAVVDSFGALARHECDAHIVLRQTPIRTALAQQKSDQKSADISSLFDKFSSSCRLELESDHDC